MTPEESDILRQVHTSLGNMDGRIGSMCDRLERHEMAIFGNGVPGLTTRLDRCEQEIGRARAAMNWAWTAIASSFGAMASAMAAWYKQQ